MEESQSRALALEREVKTLIAGRLTPGSGSGAIKGDAHSTQFHVEAKYRSLTNQDVPLMPLELNWLETVWNQKGARIPVLALEWADGRRLLLLPTGDWELLTDESAGDHPLRIPGRRPLLGHPGLSPIWYEFSDLQTPESEWTGLDWADFAQLRRGAQPKEESAGFRRTESGFRSNARPLQGRGFRKRPKE